jgi:hypothetical protein
MVVKLYFIDGSSSIRTFTDEELSSLGLWTGASLVEYFENNLNLDGQVEDFTMTSNGEHIFDLREYFNWNGSFDDVLIDGKELERVEFPAENSYEYNLAALEKDNPSNLYYRRVSITYTDNDDEAWRYWHDQDGGYNDDPPDYD